MLSQSPVGGVWFSRAMRGHEYSNCISASSGIRVPGGLNCVEAIIIDIQLTEACYQWACV